MIPEQVAWWNDLPEKKLWWTVPYICILWETQPEAKKLNFGEQINL